MGVKCPHDSACPASVCTIWMNLVQISPFSCGLLVKQQFKVTHVHIGMVHAGLGHVSICTCTCVTRTTSMRPHKEIKNNIYFFKGRGRGGNREGPVGPQLPPQLPTTTPVHSFMNVCTHSYEIWNT